MGKVGGHYFAFLVSSQLVNEMYKLLQRLRLGVWR